MKEDLYDDLYLEEKEEKTDFKAVLFKYTIHWPWFVACILLCMAGAWLYLRYTPPVYNISASDIIVSPYYYLQQNDVVYVTPNKTKAKNASISNSTTIWFSVVGTLVALASLIVTITK